MKHAKVLGIVSAICLSFLVNACGPQPKPEELLQLELLRNSEESAEINQLAPDAYKQCTALTQKAIGAWQDGSQADAKLYASLGQRQYTTARSQARLNEALSREKAAEEEILTLKEQIVALSAKQEALVANVQTLKASIADKDFFNVEHRIQMAIADRERAVSVEAALLQASLFSEADAKLKLASESNAYGRREEASAAAGEAQLLFVKAYELAKPEFEQKEASALNAGRQKALRESAEIILGPSYVKSDMRSTILILAGAFEMNQAQILGVKLEQLRRIAELAKQYNDATIAVAAFAQAKTKDYYDVSQRRADVVRSYLIGQGIDDKRIITTAKGKEEPRYSESSRAERGLNDRVEISLTL